MCVCACVCVEPAALLTSIHVVEDTTYTKHELQNRPKLAYIRAKVPQKPAHASTKREELSEAAITECIAYVRCYPGSSPKAFKANLESEQCDDASYWWPKSTTDASRLSPETLELEQMTFACEHCDNTCRTINGLNFGNWDTLNLRHPYCNKVDGTCDSHRCLRYYWTFHSFVRIWQLFRPWFVITFEGLDDVAYLVHDKMNKEVRQTAVQRFRRNRAVKKPIRNKGLLTAYAHWISLDYRLGITLALLYRKTNREMK